MRSPRFSLSSVGFGLCRRRVSNLEIEARGRKRNPQIKKKRVGKIISNFSKGLHWISDFFLDARWRIQSLVHGTRVVIGRDRDIGLNIHERRKEAPILVF